MTTIRSPRTFANAMTRVAASLSFETCRKIVHRSNRTVRYWSEERSKKRPTIEQALRFDIAYRLAGGEGAPFLDTYMYKLDVAVEAAIACRDALAGDFATFARESGEAIAAGFAVTLSNASERDIIRAVVEVEEAESALAAIRRRLASIARLVAGSNTALVRGTQ